MIYGVRTAGVPYCELLVEVFLDESVLFIGMEIELIVHLFDLYLGIVQ